MFNFKEIISSIADVAGQKLFSIQEILKKMTIRIYYIIYVMI